MAGINFSGKLLGAGQSTDTTTGSGVLGGDGTGGVASALGDFATDAFAAAGAQPTQVTNDNRIQLEGNQLGVSPQEMKTTIDRQQNERARTYATPAPVG